MSCLKAAYQTPTIKAVVITSSIAAIISTFTQTRLRRDCMSIAAMSKAREKVFDERDWLDYTQSHTLAYRVSHK